MNTDMQKPWDAERFNEMYDDKSFDGGVHHIPVKHCTQYPLFRKVVNEINRRKVKKVLEIGCGAGGLSELILAGTSCEYVGTDFSASAVQLAASRTGRPDLFKVANALDSGMYADADYDSIVCLEVLEHIKDDLAVIDLWRKGAFCIISLPDFGCDGHLRWFSSASDIESRYGGKIKFDKIVRLDKSPFPNISLSYRLKSVYWSGFTVKSFREALGLTKSSDRLHWFCACGVRA